MILKDKIALFPSTNSNQKCWGIRTDAGEQKIIRNYVCRANGGLVDFVSVSKSEEEQLEWFRSLSDDGQQALLPMPDDEKYNFTATLHEAEMQILAGHGLVEAMKVPAL